MVVSAGARRILVVDDDPMVATTVQRVLRPEGYEVDVALGGQEALERARAHQPDLVVLDLMMPGIDGLEVCRQLRATGTLPILMLTARSGTADRVRGLDTGADDYLDRKRTRLNSSHGSISYADIFMKKKHMTAQYI